MTGAIFALITVAKASVFAACFRNQQMQTAAVKAFKRFLPAVSACLMALSLNLIVHSCIFYFLRNLRYSRGSGKVAQGGEPQTVQECTARRTNAVMLFQLFDYRNFTPSITSTIPLLALFFFFSPTQNGFCVPSE